MGRPSPSHLEFAWAGRQKTSGAYSPRATIEAHAYVDTGRRTGAVVLTMDD